MDRRSFIKQSTAVLLAGASADCRALIIAAPTIFYADGYHGGARGHMPPGCWRDILEALKTYPDWKLSLDVEPGSWDVLLQQDPAAYHELQTYLADTSLNANVTLVGGTFAQPYGWAISGESNIRQLQHGLREIHRHFPAASVMVYAVQEPCWSSCLPQVLRSLGFRGASLKNASTAWGGYSAGFDAELVNWIGPDQTSIRSVPRYTCEQLVNTWETEAVDATPAYALKCVAAGIPEPVGMCFQDLGWAAHPRLERPDVKHITWQEYLFNIAKTTPKDWHFTLEDIRTTLPWGEKTLQKVAQQSRSAETRLLLAEKMAAIASVHQGALWPEDAITRAWEQVMWSQFHDSWITATTRSDRQAWAFQVAAETLEAQDSADTLVQQAARMLSIGNDQIPKQSLGNQWLRVFNTLAHDRNELVESTIALDRDTEDLRVLDEYGAVIPSQWTALRTYHPESSGPPTPDSNKQPPSAEINTARLLFKAQVPAIGFATYQVVPLPTRSTTSPEGPVKAATNADGSASIENEFYSIQLDTHRGGAITSLITKQDSQQLCPMKGEFLLNEYRGYFIEQESWRSSTDTPAQIDILESGPLRAVISIKGQIGGCPSHTLITLNSGDPQIGFDTAFQFAHETWIGDPWQIPPGKQTTEQHRSSHDGRWKLQALFPTSFAQQTVDKNGAFDVCRSQNENTYFQRWDEIKHNIILNWVDVQNPRQSLGMALFSEHTTAYTHGPDHPLSLVLGWGWEGGYWWGKSPLLGEQRSRYALRFHQGDWQRAKLWQAQSMQEQPLLSMLVDGASFSGPARHSLLSVSDEAVQLTAMIIAGNALELRLFNAQTVESNCTLDCRLKPRSIQAVELNGTPAAHLPLHETTDSTSVHITLRPFAIQTLRVALPDRSHN